MVEKEYTVLAHSQPTVLYYNVNVIIEISTRKLMIVAYSNSSGFLNN